MTQKRFVLIAVGSRGDAEPFCATAAALLKQDAVVDLFLQQDLVHLAPDSADGATVHALPFTQQDFYRIIAENGSSLPGHDHPNPRVKFVGTVAEIIGELVLPCCESVLRVVSNTDETISMILASSLARQLAVAVGEVCKVPVGLVQLQPLQPVSAFPHYSNTDACVEAILKRQDDEGNDDENLETYLEPERFQHQFLQERVQKMYINVLKSPKDAPDFETDMKAILLGERDGVVVVNAFSNLLIPLAVVDNANTWNVGPLADAYIDDQWSPPVDLVDFLSSSQRPICIGYGSMPFSQVTAVLDALLQLDRQAVLVGSCFVDAFEQINKDDNGDFWLKKNVYAIANVPYPWLLPQCSMMLSHGGAGVVNAVARAGIPHVVAPLLGDQFFWAKLLSAKKLGAALPGNLTSVTKQDIVQGIQEADDPSVQDAAAKLGEQIRAEPDTGVESLVDQLVKV